MTLSYQIVAIDMTTFTMGVKFEGHPVRNYRIPKKDGRCLRDPVEFEQYMQLIHPDTEQTPEVEMQIYNQTKGLAKGSLGRAGTLHAQYLESI